MLVEWDIKDTMETETTPFDAFLIKKKIDPAAFGSGLPGLYARCKAEFDAAGASLIEHGKKFFWNDLRMEFPLANVQLTQE